MGKLIKILKDFGYEWMILPIETVEGEREMSFEKRILMTSQPHMIEFGNETIPVIFRVRYDFIDQQAGCDSNGIYEKCLLASSILKKFSNKPALVVPASDGENGNVMLNEFFPSTYTRFFKEKIDDKVSSLAVSEFLHKFYEIDGCIKPLDKVELKDTGSSWLGSHESWIGGDARVEIKKSIDDISDKFHKINQKTLSEKEKIIYNNTKELLLIAETSCYVYWGNEYWFDQGRKMVKLLKKKMNLLIK